MTQLTVDSFGHSLPVAGLEEFDLQFIFDINRGEIPENDGTYNVTYDGNGATENVPSDNTDYNSGDTVTVEEQGSMEYVGYIFAGWNTLENGTGTSYNGDDTFSITEDTTLYAQWVEKASVTITGKPFKDGRISGNSYDSENTTYLEDYTYGIVQYLYIDSASTQTVSISQLAEYTVTPSSTEDITVVYKKNGVVIGYTDSFNVPTDTSSQVAISIEIKQLGVNIANSMIYIRKMP